MRASRGVVRAALLAVMLLLAGGLTGQLPLQAAAQVQPGLPWEQLGVPGPVYRLFTPPSGALFALTESGLYRSVDGGTSWSLVPIHPPRMHRRSYQDGTEREVPPDWDVDHMAVAVSPIDADTIYAQVSDGLGKTTDGGTTWTTVLPARQMYTVATSVPDPQLVYAVIDPPTGGIALMRSRDGGSTWDTAIKPDWYEGGRWLEVLQPHPVDPDQLFLAQFRSSRGGWFQSLARNEHQGAQSPPQRLGETVFSVSYAANGLIMTADPSTGRMGLGISMLEGRSSGKRSIGAATSMDGVTWDRVAGLDAESLAALGYHAPLVAGVALLPGSSTGLYLAINDGIGNKSGGILAIQELAAPQLLPLPEAGLVSDLAVSIDGTALYAATDNGLWRLPQPASQPLK